MRDWHSRTGLQGKADSPMVSLPMDQKIMTNNCPVFSYCSGRHNRRAYRLCIDPAGGFEHLRGQGTSTCERPRRGQAVCHQKSPFFTTGRQQLVRLTHVIEEKKNIGWPENVGSQTWLKYYGASQDTMTLNQNRISSLCSFHIRF